MKKILFVDNGKEFGGGTKSFLYLLEGLVKLKKYEIYVFFENDYKVGNDTISKICNNLGANFVFFDKKQDFSKIKKEFFRLFGKEFVAKKIYEYDLEFVRRVLLSQKFDLIHLNNHFSSNLSYIKVANELGIKVVQHLRKNSKLMKFELQILKNLNFKTISVSCSTRDFYLEQLKIDKNVIYNPVEIDEIIPTVSDDFLRILMPANFLELKGHDLVFDAFLALKRKDVKLFLAGDGNFKNQTKEKFNILEKNGIAVNLGFVKNMREIYLKSDFVLGFSSAEGLPRVIIEGLSYGCGIVYSDLAVAFEIREISDNKDNFFIVKRDAKSLKECLENLKKPSKKVTDKAVIQNFSLQNYISKILEFYDEILI